MRIFIAIEIPSEIKYALLALQADLRRADADVTWTTLENMHPTLKYIGEVDEGRIVEVEKACVALGAEFTPFTLSLNGIGVFPNAKEPRVLWAGVSGEVDNLVEMHRRSDESPALVGFDRYDSYRPHLTIGRVRSNKNTCTLLALANAYRLPALSFVVTEIVVMKSEQHPAGKQYITIAKASLS